MLKKLQNVYLPIDKFQAKVFKNSDLSKRGEWVSNFALSLAGESNDDFAEELLTEAQVSFYKEKVRKWKHYIKNVLCNENEGVIPTENEIYTRCCEEYGDEFVEAVELVESNLKKNKKTKKNPQDAPNGNAGVDRKSATSCDQFTADGDTREDSMANDDVSAITRNETRANDALEPSANNCGPRQAKNGDASHREAEDESANVSNPLALDMPRPDKGEQPAKTRDSRVSGRYQPPSLGPEDGKLYDQETASGNYQPDKVSTDEKGGCGPLEKPNSQKSPQPSLFPAAQPVKRRYGKYSHVMLTDDEGRKLRESLGEDLEDAVAILDEYIHSLPVKAKGAKKNGAKWWMQEYEAKDHYIVLHHGWARKRLNEMRTEELNARAAALRYSAAETNAKAAEMRLEDANSSSQPRQMYLTSDDISRRNAEEGWRQLQLMHQMEGNG